MSRGRTIARMLPWVTVASVSMLSDRLLRIHEQRRWEHHALRARLERVEQQLEILTRLPLAPAGTIQYHPVKLKQGPRFEIGIDPRRHDLISQAIASGNSWFLDDYNLLLDRMQPGDRVLDLGGHLGSFGLAAAALGCQVICVEAAPDNVALLRASVARNGFEQMRVVHSAVSDHAGTLEFMPNGPWGTVANPAVARSPALIYAGKPAISRETVLNGVEVPALTVDELLDNVGWEHVDFIKMDIEGSEVAAIRGMDRLLARPDAPVLLYESNAHTLAFFDTSPEQLTTMLCEHGYSPYAVLPPRLVAVRPSDVQYKCVVNCLAMKGQLPRIPGWRVVDVPSVADTVLTITNEAVHGWPFDRAYLARTLAQAEPAVLAHSQTRLALKQLCQDRDESVRAAAAWFKRA